MVGVYPTYVLRSGTFLAGAFFFLKSRPLFIKNAFWGKHKPYNRKNIRLFLYAGKSLTRGPLYGPSAARADGRRTKFDWREVRTMNSWSHLMQQHAAHGVRAQSSQLQTRPGLWPPAPEVKPKATSGVLSSCNRRGMPAVCKPHTDAKKAIACKSRPGQAPFEPRSGSKTIPGGWQGPTFLW